MSTTVAVMVAILISVIAFLVVCLMMFVGIVVHELGHLCGCFLVGWKPLSVHFGTGRSRILFRAGDLFFTLGINPFSGLMKGVAVHRGFFKLKNSIFILGGPVATVALTWVAYTVMKTAATDYLSVLAGLFMIAQLLVLAGSIIPFRFPMDGQMISTDILNLWNVLWLNKQQKETRYLQHRYTLALFYLQEKREEEAMAVLKQCLPDRKDLEVLLIYILLGVEKIEEAKMRQHEVMENLEGNPDKRLATLDGLACIPLFTGQMELLDVAIQCVDKGLAEAPERITLKGTRASLLVEKGRLDEGIALLQEVLAKTDSDNDRAICKYYMALACRRKGEVVRAREWLLEAQKIGPACVMRQRIENEIAGGSAGKLVPYFLPTM